MKNVKTGSLMCVVIHNCKDTKKHAVASVAMEGALPIGQPGLQSEMKNVAMRHPCAQGLLDVKR